MMNPKAATYEPAPLIEPGHTFASISDKIGNVVPSIVLLAAFTVGLLWLRRRRRSVLRLTLEESS